MKFTIPILVVFFVMSCTNAPKTDTSQIPDIAATSAPAKTLRHVVLFSFKETASAANIKEVEAAFSALPTKIKEIQAFEWGLNNSPEGLNKGFTHCYLLSFKNEAERDTYITHPDHVTFGTVLKPYLEDVLVVDYWNN